MLTLTDRADQPAALSLRQRRIGRVADQRIPEKPDLLTAVRVHPRPLLTLEI